MNRKREGAPAFAVWLLDRLSRESDRDSIGRDFNEIYEEIADESGRLAADIRFWALVLKSIPMLMMNQIFWGIVMFKNYFKTAMRNLVRHKLYSFINISGLAVGMFCFLCIVLWVKYEKSYDRFHPDFKNLYQVVFEYHGAGDKVRLGPTHAAALGPAIQKDYPEIQTVARVCNFMEMTIGTGKNIFMEEVRFVDPAFLEMFAVRFIEGDRVTALSRPESIVLTESAAAKHFKKNDALGKEIRLGGDRSLTVTGVIEEMPVNSHFESKCMIPLDVLSQMGKKLDQWGEQNYRTYVRLNENSTPQEIENKIRFIYRDYNPDNLHSQISIRPVTDIHLHDLGGGGLITTIYIFSILAGFILFIAIINFMNLSTARSTSRAKEIGIRKVTGANRAQIAKQFMGEAVLAAAAAALPAVILLRLFLPAVNRLVGAHIVMEWNGGLVLLAAGIALSTGFLAGIYPALMLSSFQANRILKGGFNPKGGKIGLRRFLVIFQFSISIFLIIGMMVVNRQLNYMRKMDLGYNRENLICLRYTGEMRQNYQAVKTELLANPMILGMTRANHTLDSVRATTSTSTINWEGKAGDNDIGRIHVLSTDQDFVQTLGIDMVEGRFFSLEYPSDQKEAVILNQTAVKAMGLDSPVGKKFSLWSWNLNIIGVMEDFHLYSLQSEIQPVVVVMGRAGLTDVIIRTGSQNLEGTISYIKETIGRILPGYVVEYQFLDEKLQNIYKPEQRMQTVTGYLTFLAIFISCMGLLGLTAFTAQQKTKEIGIRRVLGASPMHIVWMLFRGTAKWVLAANLAAWPVTYLIIRSWLQNYAYRTAIDIGVFLSAGALTLTLTFLTVGRQCLKAALSDPAVSLKYE